MSVQKLAVPPAAVALKRYSGPRLWTLFLACAFLPHVWTFIQVFKDFSMLIGRTGPWGAIGVMAYGLLFAFLESLLIFGVTVGLGLLVSTRWDESRRIAVLSFLAAVPMAAEMLGQAYSEWQLHVPGRLTRFLAQFPDPSGVLYALTLLGVLAGTLLPVLLILRRDGFYSAVRAALERIGTLSGLYLVFDALALVVVIVRNGMGLFK